MKGTVPELYILVIIRMVVGGIFCWAGIIKIANPQLMADHIAAFDIMPTLLINIMAMGVPPLELIVGLLLIMSRMVRLAAFGGLFLLGVFTLGLLQALARGLIIDCGCFGEQAPSDWTMWIDLCRDGCLILALSFFYLRNTHDIGTANKDEN